MKSMRKLSVLMCCCLLVGAVAAAEVMSSQAVSLVKGWNAFYLTVSPVKPASEVFADWPVNFVSAYDQSAFLETHQYSSSGSTEGAAVGDYRTWYRTNPGISSLVGLPANTVYVCFATNAMPARTVFGRPSAPRITWHASAATEPMNLVGFSTFAPTTLGTYFDGLDIDATTYKQFYGTDPASVKQRMVYEGETLPCGSVVLSDSSKVSDWSGVLNVSPISGVDFGTNGTLAALQVRNDGAAARTVRVALSAGTAANLQDVPPVPTGLMVKDASTAAAAATNAWVAFQPSMPFDKVLQPGETLNLRLALDRSLLTGPAGTYYGALLQITDEDGGSRMKVVLPLEATGDGGASSEFAWPKGIWLATAELDTVTFVGAPTVVTNTAASTTNDPGMVTVCPTTEIAAGGKMSVRLPMYVDGRGEMTLLQRFWYGRDGEGTLHVVAGSETSEVPLSNPRRVSTAFLPTDRVKIPAGSGAFGTTATFPFVVAETSNVNPMRHALHPQHDGKRFDFMTPSPSGDDLDNYRGAVKPEAFSVTNTVNFTWSPSQGTAWSPDETLSGRLVWEFGGLRHEGTVRASGPFVMKRISSATLEK